MQTGFFFIYVIAVAFIFAKLEIAIEGPHGWAEKLPVKRYDKNHILSRLFFSGRPATSYHLWMFLFILSLLHSCYVFIPFSVGIELRLISFFIFLLLTEDFLWFALNPSFRLEKFKKQHIWWHADNWWYIAPQEYFVFPIIGAVLYIVSFYLTFIYNML